MIKKIEFSVLFICVIFVLKSEAQQSILLMSGNRVIIKDYRIDSSGVVLYKDKRMKVHGLEIDDVFSVIRADSVEEILYKPVCKDVCFRINQMRDYLTGIADGKKEKTFWYGAGNFSVGCAASFFLAPFLVPVPVAGTSSVAGVISPKENKLRIPENYKENAYYKEGYVKSVKRKRIISSIIGGGSGILIGFGILAILAH
jgi:hypothetical protein